MSTILVGVNSLDTNANEEWWKNKSTNLHGFTRMLMDIREDL